MSSYKYNEGDYIGPNHDILILKRAPKGNSKRIRLKCPVCGREDWEVDLTSIHKGVTRCSKCYKKERIKNLSHTKYKTGDKIGPYNIKLERYIITSSMDGKQKTICEFLCPNCNKPFRARLDHVVSGATAKCPECRGISYSEDYIAEYLKDLGITYIRQYSFDDKETPCINPSTGYKLFFDFYLPDYNCCIEYDGKQHFEAIDYFGGEEGLVKTQYRDKVKNEFCLSNNILCVRIDYNKKGKEIEDILSSLFERM